MADLDREIETLTALREATREAREAAKDLRAEVKAAREARREFFAAPELEARLGKLTEEALAAVRRQHQAADRAGDASRLEPLRHHHHDLHG